MIILSFGKDLEKCVYFYFYTVSVTITGYHSPWLSNLTSTQRYPLSGRVKAHFANTSGPSL